MKYRIYALIHGEILPKGKIFGCEIRRMSFAEQKRRGFSPIQSVFSKNITPNFEKTYVTCLPYVDPIRIKSQYVIIYDTEAEKPNYAVGGASKAIDRVCRYLSIACLEDVKREFGRQRGSFEPYIFQVNKIYELNAKGVEKEIKFTLQSGFVYLPNRPEFNKWRNKTTKNFLEEVFNFHDETLERSLKYLYRSSIGPMLLDSPEKVALDHFKSIEIIVNSLSKKRGFKTRLAKVAGVIGITSEEQKRIEDFWDDRSKYGDIAHPSKFDEVERYPDQFPVPSNTRYPGGSFDSIAPNIILKYYEYIKGVYTIEIENPRELDTNERSFAKVYEPSLWGTIHKNNLVYFTYEQNNQKLKQSLKKDFAKEYKITEDSIVEVEILPNKDNILHEKRIKLRVCTTI